MTNRFIQAAIAEARQGLHEGGIPIGSVLVIEDEIVARGHNQRVQQGSLVIRMMKFFDFSGCHFLSLNVNAACRLLLTKVRWFIACNEPPGRRPDPTVIGRSWTRYHCI